MSEISSVNTSFYPELLEGYAPNSLLAIAPVGKDSLTQDLRSKANTEDQENEDAENTVRNYYANTKIENWLTKVGNNLIQSAQELDNSMVSAINNGYSVQDACNIKRAEMAYKANAHIFNIAEEMSTFALDV